MKKIAVSLPGFPGRLRQLRVDKGLSQKELGDRCEWKAAQSRIKNYEDGTRDPSGADVRKLAVALGTTPHYLYFGSGQGYVLPIIPWASMMKPTKKLQLGPKLSVFWPLELSLNAIVKRVPDDSLAPFAVKGEYWVIDPDAHPQNGDIVLVTTKRHDTVSTTVYIVGKISNRIVFKDLHGCVVHLPAKAHASQSVGVLLTRIIPCR